MLTEYAPNAEKAFHAGKLPIVMDALDEGRLLSHEGPFEAFLESTVAFLGKSRVHANSPKAILLAREETAELSSLAVEITNHEISTCTLQLDFFDQDAASRLIDLSVEKELSRLLEIQQIKTEDYNRRREQLSRVPMGELKDAYFSAIESALELDPGSLWELDRGRTFAGYAPVLGSIGTLLATVDNPLPVTNRLKATAAKEAWEVIDTVIHEIIEREQKKLSEQLTEVSTVPENAYNRHEQLSYLTQLIGGQQRLSLTSAVRFNTDTDRTVYLTKVSQFCPEHPFIRSRKVANDVLGSAILAHAICNLTQFETAHTALLQDLCRGPFLWRAFSRELANMESPLFDGQFVGYLLNSYWNDPMEQTISRPTIRIAEVDSAAEVTIINSRGAKKFTTIPPITFYSQIQDCEITTKNLELVFEGATADRRDPSSHFAFRGDNRVLCEQITYSAASTDASGSLWLQATKVKTTAHDPEIRSKGDFQYGWGGAVVSSEPWKQLGNPTLSTPFDKNPLAQLFEDCSKLIPSNGIVLMGDYSIPENDNSLNWMKRHGEAIPTLIKLLVKKGLANRTSLVTQRSAQKYMIAFKNMPWDEIKKACDGRTDVDEAARDLVAEVKEMTGMDG